MKNSLSQKEIEDASKRFCEHKGPYLTIDQVMFSANSNISKFCRRFLNLKNWRWTHSTSEKPNPCGLGYFPGSVSAG